MKPFKLRNLLFLSFFFLIFLNSCGSLDGLKKIHRPVDLRKEPLDPDEKARKNIKEGRGISLGSIGNNKTTYEFSTSNPMWRATLETLDFLPLSTVDYSGGLIVSDWYNDANSNSDSIKITVRFLSNEIQSNSLKIYVHKKSCYKDNNCSTKLIKSNISEELIKTILSKAAFIDKNKNNKDK